MPVCQSEERAPECAPAARAHDSSDALIFSAGRSPKTAALAAAPAAAVEDREEEEGGRRTQTTAPTAVLSSRSSDRQHQ